MTFFTPITAPDAEVILELIATSENGRKTAVHTGYSPIYKIVPDHFNSVRHVILNEEQKIHPGETEKAKIWFITKEPQSLFLNQKINVYEGLKLVGYATVINIFNSSMERK